MVIETGLILNPFPIFPFDAKGDDGKIGTM